MKVRTPTRLIGYRKTPIRYNDIGLFVDLVCAIPSEIEEIIVPSYIKDTEGHGNCVTHTKPLDVQELYTWEPNKWIREGWDLRANSQVRYDTHGYPTKDTTVGHRGTVSTWYWDYRDPFNLVDSCHCWILWYCIKHDKVTGEKVFRNSYCWEAYIYADGKVSADGRSITWRRERHYEYNYKVVEEGDVPHTDVWGIPYTITNVQQIKSYDYVPMARSLTHELPPATYYFWFNEPGMVWDGMPRHSVVERAMTQAFTTAFDQVPQYADNNIANMLEIGQMCVDLLTANPESLDKWGKLIKKHGSNIFSSRKNTGKFIRDAWMMYRYQYCTTSSDVRQAIDAAGRRAVTYCSPLRFDGNASIQNPFDPGEAVSCHCQFSLVLNTTNVLANLHHYMQMYGVSVSAYKMWDLVPFSFVVDWFTDIGGMLETQEKEASLADYIFSDFWWSVKYVSGKSGNHYKCYTRWSEHFIPEHLARDYNRSSEPSTWLKRLGDSYCLTHK